jgi:ABC-type transport system involved in multi-copper enzyme maturation permease subunit
VASVSPEIDSGALHAVLARPLSRLQYLLGRFLALAGLLTAYVLAMSGSLLLTARIVAGYQPGDATRVVGLMILQVFILLAVSLLGSTVLPTLANGVVMLVLFGLAWLGGVIGFIGTIPPGNELMANLGTAVSLLLPADAVWRGASFHVLPPSFLVATSFAGQADLGLPFGSTAPIAPAMLAWALAYPVACLVWTTPPRRIRGGVDNAAPPIGAWATLPFGAPAPEGGVPPRWSWRRRVSRSARAGRGGRPG